MTITEPNNKGDHLSKVLQIGANDAERRRNAANGAGVVFDFHPRVDQLRRHGDVLVGGVAELLDIPKDIVGLPRGDKQVTVLSFVGSEHVFRQTETFSSEHGYGSEVAKYWGANILMMDEPEHRKYRALAQPAFARKTMEVWEQRWLTPMLDRLIDAFPSSGPIDLYNDYCARFPVNTIAMGFGIAPEDVGSFHGWVNDSSTGPQKMNEYLTRIIGERRSHPDDSDVIGLLAQSQYEDSEGFHELTDAEILGFANLMLVAGAGTTYRTMGVMLVELLKRPTLLEQIRNDHSRIPAVIEETLRWSPPVPYFPRLAVEDTTIDGVPIAKGTFIDVFIAAANRDQRRWEDPHTWNPDREQKAHLAFGFGPHFCIGNQLARMELQIGLERLLDRVPQIVLDPGAPEPEVTGLLFRMPTAVPAIIG